MPTDEWSDLTTLDISPDHNPDVIHDLEDRKGLPFEDSYFDELHAYEVLEHTGGDREPGDWKFFFWQFGDFWRVLKSGGYIFGTCPSYRSMWAWGDPGHRRVLTSGHFVFLSRAQYESQVGRTAMSDYRSALGKTNYETLHCVENVDHLEFVLKALK